MKTMECEARHNSSWAVSLVSARNGERESIEHERLPLEGAPWLVEYDLDREKGRRFQEKLATRSWDLWRYSELLPISNQAGLARLGEGGTPLIRQRNPVRDEIEVWFKEESGNPTGSFKDRGLCLAVNRARELGAKGVQLPSAGNAALAAAAYSAAAGIRCRLALPTETPAGIARRCRLYGAQVLEGGGTLGEAASMLGEFIDGFWDLSTFKEPYRVEGKKTMAFEVAEQLGWRLPHWMVYPTGGGTGIVAMLKAIEELQVLGLVEGELPRFVVVQMEGCAPLVEAFEQRREHATPWKSVDTSVWGLRVPKSLADFLILRALTRTRGVAIRVEEAGISDIQALLARDEGLFVGPEGAAAYSGVIRLARDGIIKPGQSVVVFQTGHPSNYL